MSLEEYDEYAEYVLERAEEHTLKFLRNDSRFYDDETFHKHLERNIWRSQEHLRDCWEVHYTLDGTQYECEITNTKYVGKWNLFKDILESGTHDYVVPFGKKKMTFWSRYADHWYFNMQSRRGIGGIFVSSMEDLIDEASEYGIGEAMEDADEELDRGG